MMHHLPPFSNAKYFSDQRKFCGPPKIMDLSKECPDFHKISLKLSIK
jgi:hypothetical protein